MEKPFNLKTILEIIFKVTNKNANILAQRYLLKDESIISKWKKNKAFPRNDDISKIVEFVLCESTYSQRKIIMDNIVELLNTSEIDGGLKDIILNTKDYGEFLREAVSSSISEQKNAPETEYPVGGGNFEGNIIAGYIENNNGRFTGNLSFDMLLAQDHKAESIHTDCEPGLEFNGKVNLVTGNKFVKASKHAKKAATFGVVFLLVASVIAIASSYSNVQKNEIKVLNGKNLCTPHNGPDYDSNIEASTPVPAFKPSPVFSPVSTACDTAGDKLPGKVGKEENKAGKPEINKPDTEINDTKVENSVNKNIVVNNGDNSVIIVGNQNSVGIEK